MDAVRAIAFVIRSDDNIKSSSTSNVDFVRGLFYCGSDRVAPIGDNDDDKHDSMLNDSVNKMDNFRYLLVDERKLKFIFHDKNFYFVGIISHQLRLLL